MRLDRILELAPWEETEACFRRDYCGARGMEGQDDDEFVQLHKGVYQQLCIMKAEPDEFVINIDTVDADGEPVDTTAKDREHFFSVFGRKPGDDKGKWSLEVTPWERWLGMAVAATVLRRFSAPEIIAHCLWEMSFDGYTQDAIQGKADALHRRMRQIDEEIDEAIGASSWSTATVATTLRRMLAERGWTEDTLAAIIGEPRQVIHDFVSDKRGVDINAAFRLAVAFDNDLADWVHPSQARFWGGSQSYPYLWDAGLRGSEAADEIARRARVATLQTLKAVLIGRANLGATNPPACSP